ncbi:hypothetical protein [Bacillus sp. Brlt_9]|uniref:hypothetical protein n=1 Tax=Bacillus sp. Brlt_9 TaxID=3110916 RepID=UPI003F7B688B
MELQIRNESGRFTGVDRSVIVGREQDSNILFIAFECDDKGAEKKERKITVNQTELIRSLKVVRELNTYGSIKILEDSYDTYFTNSKLNLSYKESDEVLVLEIDHGFEFHFDADKIITILEALDF